MWYEWKFCEKINPYKCLHMLDVCRMQWKEDMEYQTGWNNDVYKCIVTWIKEFALEYQNKAFDMFSYLMR